MHPVRFNLENALALSMRFDFLFKEDSQLADPVNEGVCEVVVATVLREAQ
jgi:hypothetical protein